MTALPPTAERPYSSDDISRNTAVESTTTTNEAEPFVPGRGDVGISTPTKTDRRSSSSASGELWAKGIFDRGREQASLGDGKPQASLEAPAETTARVDSAPPESAPASVTEYPKSGLVGAFGGGEIPGAQHPGPTGLGAGYSLGPEAGSSVTSMFASRSSINNIAPVHIGTGAGGSAAPPPLAESPPAARPPVTGSAGQDMNRTHQAGGSASLSLFSPVPFASCPSYALQNTGEETEGIELLDASELEVANAAGVFDDFDALLGGVAFEGFGEESNRE